ncbi:MAG TPA: cob(I)yrinic acid a,c-diamide adenosyltransferase, partial [Acidobacteriota bacterium]|nr:cob(I)yrinic acid a,c-diamide adenosyltransferase [Acidobacteriota bacterium]
MGKRLTRIYTKTGDQGSTGLGDGSRVEKDHVRVEAYGTVDELNAAIGLLLSDEIPEDIAEILNEVQHDLFDLGGELCIPGHALLKDERVEALERSLDTLNAELPALEEFILPGGTRSSALCHLARTVCRRAERRVVALARKEQVGAAAIRYLNRLSDLLFVTARYLNKRSGRSDVLWDRKR